MYRQHSGVVQLPCRGMAYFRVRILMLSCCRRVVEAVCGVREIFIAKEEVTNRWQSTPTPSHLDTTCTDQEIRQECQCSVRCIAKNRVDPLSRDTDPGGEI